MESYDLIIIGAGAAGLSAGIYGARSGLKTLILEEKMAGGTTADAPWVENYPGFQSISGTELAQNMVAHAKSSGVKINESERVVRLSLRGDKKTVETEKASYEVGAVIIASGSYYRELGIPGEKEFRGRGVSYCGLCDGPFFKGKTVLVVGGGNSALITALYLAHLGCEVKVAHRRGVFRAEDALVQGLKNVKSIEVFMNTEVKQIIGEKMVRKVSLLNKQSGKTEELPVDGVFVQIGEAPNSQQAREAGVAADKDSYIIIDGLQHTNIEGVYAAGDITNHPVKQVGTAVGQGITAALEAYAFIRRPYYKR
ncbi:MAG: FAD-dependent oxidoreductase [Candidatus Bathyarchaeia archaeon]